MMRHRAGSGEGGRGENRERRARRKPERRWVGTMGLVALMTAGLLLRPGPAARAATQESVNVLSGFSVGFMVAYIADKGKLFEQEGVPVKMTYSVSGKAAVDAMVAGAGVMAISGAFPAVSAAQTAPVYVVAPITRDDESTKLIVRAGINSPADLKGKRVGYQFGSDGHLYIVRYMEKNHLSMNDITSLNIPAEALGAAFSRGDIDALVVWEPLAGKILQEVKGSRVLGGRGVVTIFNVVTVRKDFVEAHPQTAQKLLGALVKANAFIKSHPEEAIKYTAEVGKITEAQVKEIMSSYTFSMVMDEPFFDGMDAAAAFLHMRGLTKQKVDARVFVYDKLMREVAPDLVKVK